MPSPVAVKKRVPTIGSQALSLGLTLCVVACNDHDQAPKLASPSAAVLVAPPSRTRAAAYTGQVLDNRFPYIPEECYAKTKLGDGRVKNPCYVCHQHSTPPNFVDDAELQLILRLPRSAAKNPWSNLFSPAVERTPRLNDPEVIAYVRESNYFEANGEIALAGKLEALPPEWDGDGDANWTGYVPDAWFKFDQSGFDRKPSGELSGWRAFAYYPLPAFFPTNGSMDDVLIRLDPALRTNAAGKLDQRVYETNLAIVEALIKRQNISIAATDEIELGVDLDLDGKLGNATVVAYDGDANGATRMRYAGRATALQAQGTFPLAPGLFPLGTELLHSVRYLDLAEDGSVQMAARMKELRYAHKTRWLDYADLKANIAKEANERFESQDGSRRVFWSHDSGVYNGQGWLLQGFIEAKDGSLRPQTYEESATCVGCHGGVGTTTDSVFSFARKLSTDAEAHGWFHWSTRGLTGLADRARDGHHEYAFYLEHALGADDFGDNDEASARFFDSAGRLRRSAVKQLRNDIGSLLLPSPRRALDLNRAYYAVVLEQSFTKGRGARLEPTKQAFSTAPLDADTGARTALGGTISTALGHGSRGPDRSAEGALQIGE